MVRKFKPTTLGFTLIELLAVIVILSIIALIAVPVVINIINDSKKSSEEESLKLYEDTVQKMIVRKQMADPSFKPSKCEIQETGNLQCTVGTRKTDVEIEVKGKAPTKGLVTIKENKISFKNVKFNNKIYYITYAELVNDTLPSGLSPGDKYTYQVNATDTFVFYILSIEDHKVNLIMDRNICGYPDSTNENNGKETKEGRSCLIRWYSSANDNSSGPVTAMQGLYNATKNWTNVPDMDLSGNNKYSDEGNLLDSRYGYGTMETTKLGIKITKKDKVTEVTGEGNLTPAIAYEEGKPLKARLPKLEEVYNTGTDENHCHNGEGSCPAWLTNGLAQYLTYYSNNEHIEGIQGYWTLSSTSGNFSVARLGYYTGMGTVGGGVAYNSGSGLRPVITVPIEDLR